MFINENSRTDTGDMNGMVGGYASTEQNTIDIFVHKGASVLHRQVEMRQGKVFMRLKKRSVTRLLGV